MKDDTIYLNDKNLSRLLRRQRKDISLKYWLGWAGGYASTKKEENEDK
ncbi:hypothetical protein [Pseudozobellia thermophila]|uniref:Uncharacterized protein n=1 Tax=Pseudozobellia thermophila TaxID=192903 RepID=A0A1M6AVY7_9FLAO|nr:hypothetical protein [Pseudozobellia thermophila]SHI40719.1 hypothetical protein SAMN04488513_101204 [Pseudozobellia thermophila]